MGSLSLLKILRSVFIRKKPRTCDRSAANKTFVGEKKNFFFCGLYTPNPQNDFLKNSGKARVEIQRDRHVTMMIV